MECTKFETSPPTYSARAYAALFDDFIIVAFNKSLTVYCFPAVNFIPYGTEAAFAETVTLSSYEICPFFILSNVNIDVIIFVTEANGRTSELLSSFIIFPFTSPINSAL